MIQIGRVRLPGWLETMNREGDQLTLVGWLDAGSYDEMIATTTALERTANNRDEPVVPVLVPEAKVAEFGRVTEVVWDFSLYEEGQWRAQWTVVCGRVGNSSQPVITSALQQYLRTNAHSFTTANYFHAVPAAATQHTWLHPLTAVDEVRPTNPQWAGAGGVRYRRVAAGVGQTTARWSCPADRWYDGGCHVESAVGGEWLPVVGRVSLGQPWRITNGLVQVTVLDAGSSAGRVKVEWYRPVSTAAPYTREFGIRAGSADATAWESAEVTRLSPNTVSVRVSAPRTNGQTTMVLTLRRGDRNVIVNLHKTIDSDPHRVQVLPTEACTLSGTMTMEVSASSSGAQWFIASASAVTYTEASGVAVPDPTSTTDWTVSIGASFGSAGGDSTGLSTTVGNFRAVQSVLDGFPP